MNKKIISCVLVVSFLTTQLHTKEWMIELKGAGFIPTNNLLKKIFHQTGMVGGEVTVHLHHHIYGFVSIDYLSKNGYSTVGNSNFQANKTKVNVLPIGIGLKYMHPFCYGNWYIGLGGLIAHVHTHDFSPYVTPLYSKWGGGGIVKTGCLFNMTDHSFIDLFVNYDFIKADASKSPGALVVSHSVNASGISIGAGLGYRF